MLLLGFMLVFGVNSVISKIQSCKETETCVFLNQCPPLLKKSISKIQPQKKEVLEAFCGFREEKMLVCCPQPKNIDLLRGRTLNGSNINLNGEELLPKFCGQSIIVDKIFGGTQAPLGAYPWAVALRYQERRGIEYGCGGSIISSRYVLTAAHCVNPKELGRRKLTEIVVGDWDLSNPDIDCEDTLYGLNCAQSSAIRAGYEEIFLHPNYSKRFPHSDDIALIRLDRNIDFKANKLKPICLPPSDFSMNKKFDRPIVIGWGTTENQTKSDILLELVVPPVDDELCKEVFLDKWGSNQICAGGIDGEDSCAGDSGGVLMLPSKLGPPYMQIGVVSLGSGICGLDGIPGIYTSVVDYREWIVSNMRP